MRFAITILTGLVAAGVVGCASSEYPAGSQEARAGVTQTPPPRVRSTPAMVLPTPLSKAAVTGARAAVTQFDVVYAAGNFAASWQMLAASTRKEISRAVWVAVHDQCAVSKGTGEVAVKSIAVFGNVAVVTAAMGRTPSAGSAEEIFDFEDGGWHYMPDDPSVYQHRSVQADVSAAKAAKLCVSGRYF